MGSEGPMLVDSHCHLTDERYAGEIEPVLERARDAGVAAVVVVASTLEDAADVRALLGRAPGGPVLAGTAGVHPHDAAEAGAAPDLRSRLEEALAAPPSAVAVGECGLDFHYDLSPRQVQRRVFEVQLDVARDRGLPVVVHCREAEDEMAAMVREAGVAGVTGVLHCFPGDLRLLEAALEAGWMVSFTGLVTFRSWEGAEAVRSVPGDRYMLETDGPYMAPVPHRGKRNEPAFVARIRDAVAKLRGEHPDEVARRTTDNARRFFGLPDLGSPPAPPPSQESSSDHRASPSGRPPAGSR